MKNENRSFYLCNIIPKIASLPMILVAVGVFVGCSFWTIFYSFTNSRLLPNSRFVGLNQYEQLWVTPRWLESVTNITIYGISALVLTLVLGFLLAVLPDQKIRAESVFRTILLYPYALSFVVTGLVWQWILNPNMGLQNVVHGWGWESFTFDPLYNPDIALLALLLAGLWHGVGFVMFICLAGLRNIDEEHFKIAKMFGASDGEIFRRITFPQLVPTIAFLLTVNLIGAFKVYTQVYALFGGRAGIANSATTAVYYIYDKFHIAGRPGIAMAATVILFVIILVVTFLQNKLLKKVGQ